MIETKIIWTSVYDSLPSCQEGEQPKTVLVLIDDIPYPAEFNPAIGWRILARKHESAHFAPSEPLVTKWSHYNV